MAKRVEFVANYDHRWPGTRNETAFKAGWSGLVKDEVWEGAEAKGAAVLVKPKKGDKDEPDGGRLPVADPPSDATVTDPPGDATPPPADPPIPALPPGPISE